MLEDEQATGRQYAPFAYGPEDFTAGRISIGRIGEYDIHRTGMVGEVTETSNGIGQPDPALFIRPFPVTGTTESTAVQVVPDHPDGAPVIVDEQTAARAPAQGFNAQNPAAGAQIQHGAVHDPGGQGVKQRAAYAAAGGTNRTGYGLQPPSPGDTCADSQHNPPLPAITVRTALTVRATSKIELQGVIVNKKGGRETPVSRLSSAVAETVRQGAGQLATGAPRKDASG